MCSDVVNPVRYAQQVITNMWETMQQHQSFDPVEPETEEFESNKSAKQEFIELREHPYLYHEYLKWNSSGVNGSFKLPPPPPLELPVKSQIILITIYTLATVLAFVGNTFVIYICSEEIDQSQDWPSI